MTEDNGSLKAAASALLTFAVALVLLSGRDTLNAEIIVLLLALTVVIAGRLGSRPGGLASAAMAAASFDFFHTKPYYSLKISSGDDIAVTFVLLAVGLVAGDLAARASKVRQVVADREVDADTVSRLLDVAGARSVGDLTFAVTYELTQLLSLRECDFTAAAVDLPEMGANGSLNAPGLVYRDDGFELPAGGVSIPVVAQGSRLGSIVCVPEAKVGIGITRRKTAVVAAHILGLAMASDGRLMNRKTRERLRGTGRI